MENNIVNLENNKMDYFASVAKATFGAVPLVGSFLGELVGQVIPNQRIDRIAKYIKVLEEKISEFSPEKMKELIQDDEFVSLVEESFIQASRATTDERREYIASIVVNGIDDENVSFQESKFLLRLLQELNDIEVLWLRFYVVPIMGGDNEFRTKHEKVFKVMPAYMGANDSVRNKATLKDSYIAHLVQLKLLKTEFSVDNTTGLPKFDSSGQQEIRNHTMTPLGVLLLKHINQFVEGFYR